MKKERRHQLSQNQLAQWLEKIINNLKPHSATISRGVFVVLVALLLFLVWRNFSVSNRAGLGHDVAELRNLTQIGAASEDLEKTINSYLVKYPSGEGNVQVSLVAGDFYFTHGVENINAGKRDEAIKQLEKSQSYFKSAAEKSINSPHLTEQALWGLGQVSESLAAVREGKDLDDAIVQYETICKKYPDGVYVKLAEEHLDLLKLPGTKIFLNEFQKSDVALFKPEFETPDASANPDAAAKELDETMPTPGSFNPGLLEEKEEEKADTPPAENKSEQEK